jgi:hypothetical protein
VDDAFQRTPAPGAAHAPQVVAAAGERAGEPRVRALERRRAHRRVLEAPRAEPQTEPRPHRRGPHLAAEEARVLGLQPEAAHHGVLRPPVAAHGGEVRRETPFAAQRVAPQRAAARDEPQQRRRALLAHPAAVPPGHEPPQHLYEHVHREREQSRLHAASRWRRRP